MKISFEKPTTNFNPFLRIDNVYFGVIDVFFT